MYVCLCKAISEDTIIKELSERKNQCPRMVFRKLGVGSECGACCTYANEMVKSWDHKDMNHPPRPPAKEN